MKTFGFVRGLLFAGLCGIGSLLLTQAASAVTITSGGSQDFQFTLGLNGSNTYSSFQLEFDGLSGSAGATLSAELFNGSNSSLSDAVSLTLPDNTSANLTNGGALIASLATPFYARVTNTSSGNVNVGFLTLLANAGATTTRIIDIAPTPIPASLPLFLTGVGLLYGFTRSKKKSGAWCLRAT